MRRLHALVRYPCADPLATEEAVRKRSLHAGIVRALARRGQLVAAWHQAGAAGNAGLFGELVARAGVFDIWLRVGVPGHFSAKKFLTPQITASHPRTVLLRSVVLRMTLKVDEAVARFESARRDRGLHSRPGRGGRRRAGRRPGLRAGGPGWQFPPRRAKAAAHASSRLPASGMATGAGGFVSGCGTSCWAPCERARFDECRWNACRACVPEASRAFPYERRPLVLAWAASCRSARVRDMVLPAQVPDA